MVATANKVGFAAFAVIALVLACLLVLAPDAAAQARVPFGIGGGEGAATAPGNAIAAWILARQSDFYRAMSGAVRSIPGDPYAFLTLLGLGFAYGIFHAAGPGHGKAVIASYVIADARAVRRGFMLALAAALLQGVVAVSLVLILARLLGFTSLGLTAAAGQIETLSYVAIVAFGMWLVFRKGRAFLASLGVAGVTAPDCGHVHIPSPEVVDKMTLREAAGVAFAAGIRPCTGSILIMVFTLSQGLLIAGLATVLAISLGTAITTGAVAMLAVYAKQFAVGMAAGQSRTGERLARGVEFMAALAVLALGAALLSGYLASAAGA